MNSMTPQQQMDEMLKQSQTIGGAPVKQFVVKMFSNGRISYENFGFNNLELIGIGKYIMSMGEAFLTMDAEAIFAPETKQQNDGEY